MLADDTVKTITITAFSDAERQSTVGSPHQVVLKDESFRRVYSNQFKKYRGINISGRKANYAFTQSSQVTLTLMFDNTGIFEDVTANSSVSTQIDDFIDGCFNLQGAIHEPHFLTITWGEQTFECRMQKADVKYTMFNRDGSPLRAEIEAIFIEDIDDAKRAKIDNLQSPDLTHLKTVKEGDTLPLLTKEVYGTPKYYTHIAKVNNLNHFRDIKPGQKLYFPPLIK